MWRLTNYIDVKSSSIGPKQITLVLFTGQFFVLPEFSVGQVFPLGLKVATVERGSRNTQTRMGGWSFKDSDEGTPVSSPRGKRFTRSIACAAACCLSLLVSPIAHADPGDPVIPSQQAVDDAQQQVASAQGSVDSIEAQLTAANVALENLGIAAGKAAEAYDGAVYRWQLAHKAAVDREGAGGSSGRNRGRVTEQPGRVRRQPRDGRHPDLDAQQCHERHRHPLPDQPDGRLQHVLGRTRRPPAAMGGGVAARPGLPGAGRQRSRGRLPRPSPRQRTPSRRPPMRWPRSRPRSARSRPRRRP